MQYLVFSMLLIVAAIHLLPVIGVIGAERLELLYGVPIEEANLIILMRHRAVLLGLVGGLTSLAAFLPQFQNIAFAAGFISVLSYMWLVWSSGDANPQLQRVFAVDLIALVCLVIGSLAKVYMHFRISP